jgi:hypothetical protein
MSQICRSDSYIVRRPSTGVDHHPSSRPAHAWLRVLPGLAVHLTCRLPVQAPCTRPTAAAQFGARSSSGHRVAEGDWLHCLSPASTIARALRARR